MPFVWSSAADKREVFAAVWGIASKIEGTWLGESQSSRRETPYASVTHALRTLLVNRVDGYAMANVGSPDRLAAHAGQVTGGGPKRAPGEGPQTDLAEELAVIERAYDRAYDEPTYESDLLGRRTCEFLLLCRYVARKPAADLASRLGDEGIEVTADRVARVTSHGMRRIAAPLERAGLVPRVGVDGQRTTADLFGWGQVAAHLGISVSTAQRWQRLHGMPIRFVRVGTGYRVEAASEELASWKDARTIGGAA